MRPNLAAGLTALLALVLLVSPPTATAGTISVAWDPVPGATGYRVYQGTSSGQYAASRDVGSATSTTLTGLADCTTWFVAVKAYNAGGESTAFSNEVSGWPRPVVTSANPAAALQGDQVSVELTGTNFRSGAVVEIDNPDVFLESTSTLSCSRLQFLVTVEPTAANVRAAEVGRFGVTVANPDDTFGTRADTFEVRIDPARFDVNRDNESTRDRLDGWDTVLVARFFGSQEGQATYDPDIDLNGDGWVDGEDLAYLAGVMGQCWSGAAWSVNACATR